jgi:parallel beta-helix repeat protein
MWNFIKRHRWLISSLLTAIIVVSVLGVQLDIVPKDNGSPIIGQGQVVLRIGTKAEASGTVDYVCDGVDDDIQFQGALDALPANGGTIEILVGNYDVGATVTRAIDNVTIVGTGRGTYITYNAVNYIFTAGGNNWQFKNLRTDVGSINMGATTGWSWENVTVNTDYYAYRTPRTSTTGADWEIPTGRATTYVIAASDAPDHVKAQADYVCDGTADNVEVQASVNALSAGRTWIETVKLIGNFSFSNAGDHAGSWDYCVQIPSYTRIDLTDAVITLANLQNATLFQNLGWVGGGDSDIEVVGGILNGNQAQQTHLNSANIALLFVDVTGLWIEGCNVQDWDWVGIAAEGTIRGEILNNRVYDIATHDGMFITGSDVLIQGNTVDTGADWGIVAGGAASISATSGALNFRIIANHASNFTLTGIGVSISSDCLIEANTVKNCITGIAVTDRSESTTVSGNTVKNITTDGIVVEDASDTTVVGNTVNVVGRYGILVNGGYTPTDTLVLGNTVKYAGSSGIVVGTGVRGVVIQANSSVACTVAGIMASGVGIEVVDNICEGNLSTGISFDAATYSTIRGNTIRNNGNGVGADLIGLQSVNGSYNLIEGNYIYDNSTTITSLLSGNPAGKASTGQKIVYVIDATKFWIGQQVTISDTTPDTENNTIAAIDDTYGVNKLTMTNNLIHDYEEAATAVVTGRTVQLYGIYEYGGCSNNNYLNNYLAGSTAAYATSSGVGNIVRGNKGYIASGEIQSFSGTLTAGVANAIAFAWHNPYAQDGYTTKVVIVVSTPGGTALSVLQVGIADDATGTNLGSEFFTGLDLNTAALYDSYIAGDTGAQTKWVLIQDSVSAIDGWIVGKILTQNASSLVGKYYIVVIGK